MNVDIQSEGKRVISAPPGFISDMVEQNPEPPVTNSMQMEAACQMPNESPRWSGEVRHYVSLASVRPRSTFENLRINPR